MIKNITAKFTILVSAILLVILVLWFVYESPEEMLAKIEAGEHYNHLYKQALYEAGLEEKEHDLCSRWAFGEDYLSMQWRNTNEAWNERHGDIFIIYGSDDAYDAFKRIGEAYKNRRKK